MRGLFCTIFIYMSLTTAHAQYQKVPGSQKELREYTQEYAKCMVRNYHSRARELVLSNTPNERLERQFGDIYSSKPLAFFAGCRNLLIRDGIGFVLLPELLRAALAEALIFSELIKLPENDFGDRALLAHWEGEPEADFEARLLKEHNARKKSEMGSLHQQKIVMAWLSRFGECVVRGNPRASHVWITSKDNSVEEDNALKLMQPVFGDCLAEGERLNFGKYVLRDTVAINYYRLALAKPVIAIGVRN
jgi:hypothetical protein